MADVRDKAEYGTLGQEVQIEHIKAYLVKPPGGSDKAVILASCVYGWTLRTNRYLADMLAANGYMVVCPDFFVGREPYRGAPYDFTINNFVETNSPTGIKKEVDAVLRFLKQQGAKHIGAMGMDWGGKAVHFMALEYPDLKAAVSVTGIVTARENCHALKCPTLFMYGEEDPTLPVIEAKHLEAKLKEKCTVGYQVKVYAGQNHTFFYCERQDITPAVQQSRKDAINWLNKFM